ncbi:uncharacterized protein C8R40DRAFT_1072441 [Lentinula edodes]|uniref:uncharacterized protein n=1 Tax=Lentinula edodes TaxID=5353 RepID=UPI001E8D04C9|nr:uncharacterized protein C8R40DRAFT_1072441 [Lentinula edodes]KAH7871373.1 hypothetical protein C8R40DRAFT_1072441 [Lentinula edodes]
MKDDDDTHYSRVEQDRDRYAIRRRRHRNYDSQQQYEPQPISARQSASIIRTSNIEPLVPVICSGSASYTEITNPVNSSKQALGEKCRTPNREFNDGAVQQQSSPQTSLAPMVDMKVSLITISEMNGDKINTISIEIECIQFNVHGPRDFPETSNQYKDNQRGIDVVKTKNKHIRLNLNPLHILVKKQWL